MNVPISKIKTLLPLLLILLPMLAAAKSGELESRFAKALSLSEEGEMAEAESLYRSLIKDYPKAPELYNNLAILLVEQNKPEQAVKVLEQGLRSHPGYARLYDNLIELNLNLSRQNYMKALVPVNEQQIDLKQQKAVSDLATYYYDSSEAEKLAQAEAALEKEAKARARAEARVRDEAKARASAESRARDEAEARANAEARARQESEARASAERRAREAADARSRAEAQARVAIQAREEAETQLRALNQQVTRAKDQIEQLKLAQTGHSQQAEVVDEVPPVMNLEDQARAAVNAWAEAWMRQDVQGYVNAYIDGYAPSGKSHRAWVEDRKVRLTRPAYIRIDLSEFEFFIIDSSHIAVQFKQKYSRKNYSDREHKELLLVLEDGRWKIEKEKRL